MEEGEQRRGEEMGLTVKQRQAVMEEDPHDGMSMRQKDDED